MSDTDSDDSNDQLEKIRNANIQPGMFVSGWEDPDELEYEDVDPNETMENKLLWATAEGKIEMVKSILKERPDCVNASDEDGYTPLHRACYNNSFHIAQILIKYGAKINAQTKFKWTPLHSSCQWTFPRCVALLLQYDADPNALSDGDQTPLHIAASVSNCRGTAMTLLMHEQIQSNLLNNSNEKPEEIAKRTGMSFPIFEMANSAYNVDLDLID